MREMTEEEKETAATLFASAPDKREGKTRLTVRFSPNTHKFYYHYDGKDGKPAPMVKRVNITLLRYEEKPALTPTGGRYIRRSLIARTKDGRKWYGTLKNGTNVVKLRLAPKEENEG